MKPAITVVDSPFYSPCASNEANQSGRERPTQHSADIFWSGFGKQRKRSSGRAGKTARKSLYEIRLFLGCDIGKGRGGIGFTGANSDCTERKNYQNFSANCNNTHPFLCHSLRTAHRIQKTCVLFFSVLPLLLFRVRSHPLPEDISNSLRRALADAMPSFPALNLYRKHPALPDSRHGLPGQCCRLS